MTTVRELARQRWRRLRNPDLLDYHRGADFLGVSERYLFKLVKEKKIPIIDMGHRTKRFRKSDLEKFLEARRRKAVGIA